MELEQLTNTVSICEYLDGLSARDFIIEIEKMAQLIICSSCNLQEYEKLLSFSLDRESLLNLISNSYVPDYFSSALERYINTIFLLTFVPTYDKVDKHIFYNLHIRAGTKNRFVVARLFVGPEKGRRLQTNQVVDILQAVVSGGDCVLDSKGNSINLVYKSLKKSARK